MKFPSAVDKWFYVFAFGLPLALVAANLHLLSQQLLVTDVVMLTIAVAAVLLPLWLLFSTTYVVEGERLVIRSGPFQWCVVLADIKAVRSTRSPMAAPALSLDRLELQYGNGRRILVSPRDRKGFLRAIGQALKI